MFDRWRISLLLGLAVGLSGSLLLFFLAWGFADPPRADTLTWQTVSDASWQPYHTDDISAFYLAPKYIEAAPFTLELTATNKGNTESAWGIWLETEHEVWIALVNREGYFAVETMNEDKSPLVLTNFGFDWREFLHIRPQTKLSLNVEADAHTTLRFNDEIAWTGKLSLQLDSPWGIICYRNPQLTWRAIEMYAQR